MGTHALALAIIPSLCAFAAFEVVLSAREAYVDPLDTFLLYAGAPVGSVAAGSEEPLGDSIFVSSRCPRRRAQRACSARTTGTRCTCALTPCTKTAPRPPKPRRASPSRSARQAACTRSLALPCALRRPRLRSIRRCPKRRLPRTKPRCSNESESVVLVSVLSPPLVTYQSSRASLLTI